MTERERIATYTDNLIGVCSIYGGPPCIPTEELRRHLSSTIREARRHARAEALREAALAIRTSDDYRRHTDRGVGLHIAATMLERMAEEASDA